MEMKRSSKFINHLISQVGFVLKSNGIHCINTFVSKYKHPLSEKHKQHLRPLTPTTKASETTFLTSRRVSRHGLRGVMKGNRLEMIRHDRRHKSVRGPSRRVWEATTTVFAGSTMGSRTHRSSCQNGVDWQCLINPPSV